MLNSFALPIRRRLMSATFALLALGAIGRAAIIQSTWQGGQSDEWSNPANWSPADSYPQNGADNYQVGITDDSISLSENIMIDSLTLNGGDLNGAFTLSVVSSGGLSFAGLNSLTSGLTLDIAGPISFADDSAALTNHGTVVFKVSGAGNYSASDATLTNASTGTLRFDPANGIAIGDSGVAPFSLINEGLLLADNGSSNYVHAPVTNSGVIRATAESELFFTTSSNFGGSLVADPLSTISLNGFNDQTHTLTQLDISGDGSVQTYSTNLTGSLKSGTLAAYSTTFTGSFTVEADATLEWAVQNAFSADSDSLTNHGVVLFSSSDTDFPTASSASFVNAGGGIITFDTSGYIGDSDTSPFELINQGTLLADNSSFNYVHAPVTNSGVIHATAESELFFTASSNFGGSFVADPLSTISLNGFNDQTHTLTQLDISGDGHVQTYSTKLTGSLKSGTLAAYSTTFTGSFTVEADASLEWAAQNAFSADSDSLTNHGVVLFSSSDNDFTTASSASFVNASAGIITFDVNGHIGDSDTLPFSLINQGLLLADNGSFNYVHAPVTNSGVIRATAESDLFFTTSSNFGGSLVADSLSTISLNGFNDQTHTLTQLDISGDGHVQTYSTNLTGSLKSGTLAAYSTTFTGSFTVEADATLEWAVQNAFSSNSDSLTNHGIVLFSSSDTDFPTASSASFVNASTGIITFDVNGHIGASDTSPFALTNHGALITGDATFNSLHVPVTNFGAIHVTGGSTLNLGSTFTQNAGETRVTNATLNALPEQTLYFNGGTLRAAGDISATLQLAHTGLEIGDEQTAGSLVVTGDLALQEGSSLRLDLNGTTQGTAYDHLAVNGTVTLGGDLVIRVSPSFLSTIQSTDTFAVLDATDITGSFANVVNGERANLPSGLGDCIVTITGTQVLLGDFVGSTLNAFLAAAGVPTDRRDHDDDYDGDGHSNLLEYALDLDPLSRDVTGLPVVATSNDTLTLTYRRVRNDVVYEVLTTTTLDDPESWTTTGVTQGLPDTNGMTTASVPLPATAAFLRLRVNYAP